MAVVWVPWNSLGIRIKKIGWVEFERIVSTQAAEHAEEIGYLQDRIESLEEHIRRLDETVVISESILEPELRGLLLKFLDNNRGLSISASRIKGWGSKQSGFSNLSKYSIPFIRITLQKLVSEGVLETCISRKGNTLYKIPE